MRKLFFFLTLELLISCNNQGDTTKSAVKNDSIARSFSTDSITVNKTNANALGVPVLRIDQCGLIVYVAGEHRDLIYFTKNGQRIGVDPIRDGDDLNYAHGSYDNVWNGSNWNTGCAFRPCTGLDVKGVNVGDVCYVSVRHGRLRDLVYCYAVVGNAVFRSKKWDEGTTEHPEYGVAVTHHGNRIELKGYPFTEDNGHFGNPTNASSFGIISFDTITKEYNYELGNKGTIRNCDGCIARVLPPSW